MATLEKIRNKAGLLVVVVGLALFAFIIGDFLRSGSTFFQQSKEKVIVVDGNAVDIREFQEKVEQRSNMARNNGTLTDEVQYQIRDQVYNETVNTILLNELASKIGLAITKEERTDILIGNNISPMIQQIPDFMDQQTGAFDKNKLTQFVQMVESEDLSTFPAEYRQQIMEMKNYWETVKEAVIEEKMQNKLLTIIASGIAVNSLDAKAYFEETSINTDFKYVSQSINTIPDEEVNVSDSEVSNLYAQRKESFKRDASRTINYIAVPIVPSEEDYTERAKYLEELRQDMASSNRIAELVNENSEIPYMDIYRTINPQNVHLAEFVKNSVIGDVDGPVLTANQYRLYKLEDIKQAPDSIYFYRLSLPNFADEKQLTLLSDSLINEVKNGKTFAEMVLEATGGQGTGDMGWQTEMSLVSRGADPKLVSAAFNANLNTPFLFKSTYGNDLLYVSEKTKPVTKYKVAEIITTVVASTETNNKLYSDLNYFISHNNNPVAFRDSANNAGYYCQTDITVLPNQNALSSIKNSRQAIRWAFDHKPGKISDIFECEDYFLVATVTGITKEGYQPLSEVTEDLKQELKDKKKGEKIVEDLKTKNLSSLESYAEAMNTEIKETKFVTFSTPNITGIGTEPAVNAKAFIAEVGQTTEPFVGNRAVYVLAITEKNTNGGEFNAADVKSQVQMQNSHRYGYFIQTGALLQENAEIEDNRSRFY